jgi:hypothetical protein
MGRLYHDCDGGYRTQRPAAGRALRPQVSTLHVAECHRLNRFRRASRPVCGRDAAVVECRCDDGRYVAAVLRASQPPGEPSAAGAAQRYRRNVAAPSLRRQRALPGCCGASGSPTDVPAPAFVMRFPECRGHRCGRAPSAAATCRQDPPVSFLLIRLFGLRHLVADPRKSVHRRRDAPAGAGRVANGAGCAGVGAALMISNAERLGPLMRQAPPMPSWHRQRNGTLNLFCRPQRCNRARHPQEERRLTASASIG